MTRSGATSVDLDMREVDPALFPNVVEALRRAGIDPERELVPVAPAAHYMMGGIATDLDGRATLPGLYAVGECSCTGLARRQPAGLQLPDRVLRVRRARRALGGRRAAPRSDGGARMPTRRRSAPRCPRPRAAPRSGATPGLERDAGGLTELAGDPHPLVRLIAGCGADADRDPRRPPPPRLPGARPRRSTAIT